jgi:hypothetical protein
MEPGDGLLNGRRDHREVVASNNDELALLAQPPRLVRQWGVDLAAVLTSVELEGTPMVRGRARSGAPVGPKADMEAPRTDLLLKHLDFLDLPTT